MNVFDLCASLRLDTSDYEGKLKEAGNSSASFSDKLKSGLGTAVKAVSVAVASASVAVGKIVSSAVQEYAEYEQLVGGVETLFGAQSMSLEEYAQSVGKSTASVKADYEQLMNAQNLVMDNASKAYKTAGLSMNDYMATVTSFSASLKQSLSSETEVAEVADRAVVDMSDNANKMGTSMESIQNAYQGFAKQNYTMLDNLKLGYGGTKTEMERLIADASKMTKEQKQLNVTVKDGDTSFGNIVNAISVMQKNLGIAGTTAKEASTTIQGSLSSMKSAWSNVLVAVSDDTQDFDGVIDEFVESVKTFGDNIMPRIKTALSGVGKLVSSLAPMIAEELPALAEEILPSLIDSAVSMVEGVIDALPTILSTLVDVVPQAFNSLFKSMKLDVDTGVITNAFTSLKKALTSVFSALKKLAEPVGKALGKVLEVVAVALDTIAGSTNAIITIGEIVIVMTSLTKAVTAVKTAFALAKVQAGAFITTLNSHPILLAVSAIVALGVALYNAGEHYDEVHAIQTRFTESEQALIDSVYDEAEAWEETKQARESAYESAEGESQRNIALYDELKNIVDANGNVKKGYEDRARVITDNLANALGIEIELVDGQIKSWSTLTSTIEETIATKRAEALLSSQESAYADALVNKTKEYNNALELQSQIREKTNRLKYVREGSEQYGTLTEEIAELQASRDEALNMYGEAEATIGAYEELVSASASGSTEEINNAIQNQIDVVNASEGAYYDSAYNAVSSGIFDGIIEGCENKDEAVSAMEDAVKSGLISKAEFQSWYASATKGIELGILDGIEGVTEASGKLKTALESGQITEGDYMDWASTAISGMPEGILDGTEDVKKASQKIAKAVEDKQITQEQAEAWGNHISQNLSSGMNADAGKVESSASNLASIIRKYLHFTEPDVGPLSDFHTYMPDMISGMVAGIKDNKYKLQGEIESLAGIIDDGLTASEYDAEMNVRDGQKNMFLGGVSINVYATENQSANDIAQQVSEIIAQQYYRQRLV